MKTFKTSAVLMFLMITFTTVVYFGCSKDRIEKTPVNSYDSNTTNSYLDSKEETEQTFVIDTNGSGPIVGNQGTTIWHSKNCLQKLNGDSVYFPYTVKLVELYKPKDMIYYRIPTVASGAIMRTDGEIRLRAFKGADELMLRPTCTAQVFMPNTAPQSGMEVYSGTVASTYWENNPLGNGVIPFAPTSSPSSGYVAGIEKLGWINCGNLAGSGTNSTLSFSSTTDDLSNVPIFIYFPATKSVMQVYNLTSGLIPNGSAVKIICIGVKANGALFCYAQSLTVSASQSITVTMYAISDANLTAYLDAL